MSLVIFACDNKQAFALSDGRCFDIAGGKQDFISDGWRKCIQLAPGLGMAWTGVSRNDLCAFMLEGLARGPRPGFRWNDLFEAAEGMLYQWAVPHRDLMKHSAVLLLGWSSRQNQMRCMALINGKPAHESCPASAVRFAMLGISTGLPEYFEGRKDEPDIPMVVCDAMDIVERANSAVGGKRWGMMLYAPEPHLSSAGGPVWSLPPALAHQDDRSSSEAVSWMLGMERDIHAQWEASHNAMLAK